MEKLKLKPINEQVMVITGGTSGIGLATVEMAAKKGARVVFCSRNEQDLFEIEHKLNDIGLSVLAVVADVRNIASLEQVWMKAVNTFGGLDTWVNNAGGSIYGPLLEIPEDQERDLFETNFWGLRNGCHVAVKALKEKGGAIINIGSEVSDRSIPLQGMYAASKHAVKAYNDALRIELMHDGLPISVSLIRPTAIDTPFPDHAVNHLRMGEPSLPDPVYHPDYVAEAIIKCATTPTRDIYVGAPSKMSSIMEFFVPGIADKQATRTVFKGQSAGTTLPHTEENEGLTHAPQKEGELLGHHKGKHKATKTMKQPHIADLKH